MRVSRTLEWRLDTAFVAVISFLATEKQEPRHTKPAPFGPLPPADYRRLERNTALNTPQEHTEDDALPWGFRSLLRVACAQATPWPEARFERASTW